MDQRVKLFSILGIAALVLVGSLLRDHAWASSLNVEPNKASCRQATPCFTQTNHGTGAAIEGVSLERSHGKYGQAAILAQANGIGGVYSFSKQAYGGEFESDGTGYALVAATDNPTGTAFLAEGPANGTGPEIQAISQTSNSPSGKIGTITAQSDAMMALYAFSKSNVGGYFESNGNSETTLLAVADNASTFPFVASGTRQTAFSVDAVGNGVFSGDVHASAFIVDTGKPNGRTTGAFGMESTRAALEDVGSGRLTNGRAVIRFDAAFASAIDVTQGYQVFLTPGGDTHGLFVAGKFQSGFIVRETMGGRSSIPFDYRVVARPQGASDARLPELHIRRPAFPNRTSS